MTSWTLRPHRTRPELQEWPDSNARHGYPSTFFDACLNLLAADAQVVAEYPASRSAVALSTESSTQRFVVLRQCHFLSRACRAVRVRDCRDFSSVDADDFYGHYQASPSLGEGQLPRWIRRSLKNFCPTPMGRNQALALRPRTCRSQPISNIGENAARSNQFIPSMSWYQSVWPNLAEI